MKKLLFLTFILFNCSIFCLDPQSRQKKLKLAVKKSDITTIVGMMKNIKNNGDSMEIFNNNDLLEKAAQKKEKRKIGKNLNILDKCLCGLIPISFITPYLAFLYHYKYDFNSPSSAESANYLSAATVISLCSTGIAGLICLIRFLMKIRSYKEAKVTYQILKAHTKSQSGEAHV